MESLFAQFDAHLNQCLQHIGADAAMHYAMQGGKRLRPQLLLDCAEVSADHELTEEEKVCLLSAAVAIEMIHSYSLVHDDLPAMDNDVLRRGRPTVHAKFGEAEGILCGDALLTGAFQILFEAMPDSGNAVLALRLMRAGSALSKAAGIMGMVGGQMLDIGSEPMDLEEARKMVMGKTAALFRAACVMGAALSGANAAQIKWADAYGQHYGIMFQLLDDFADFVHDSEEGRASYARLLGSEAEHILQQEAAEARVNAQHLDSSGLLVHRIDDMMNLDER